MLVDRKYDDLKKISGIGKVKKQWLFDSLGVYTYRTLAALSPSKALKQLEADGHNVSEEDIGGWIQEAQDKLAKKRNRKKQDEWRPFAAFIVEFQTCQGEDCLGEKQTTVHHMEGNKSQSWPGLENKQLCQWMLVQLGEELPKDTNKKEHTAATESKLSPEKEATPEPGTTAVESTSKQTDDLSTQSEIEEDESKQSKLVETKPKSSATHSQPPTTIKVEEIRLRQPPSMDMPLCSTIHNRPFLYSVLGNEPFSLEAIFSLTKTFREIGQQDVSYHAAFYACERSSGKKMFLGETEHKTLSLKETRHPISLPELLLLPGIYRLQALITLNTMPASRGYLESPLLEVV